MPISKNILLLQSSGTLGKQLVIKNYGTKVVLSNYPDMSNRTLSPRQLEANKLMKEANRYAKTTLKYPGRKNAALLRLKVLENKLYRALIKEYLLKKGHVDRKQST